MTEKILLVLFVLAISCSTCFTRTVSGRHLDPDMYRNVSELISSKGYPVEIHEVLTEDGYLLSVQRIPCGKKKQSNPGKCVVFLQHALLTSSADWVINLENQSLGFILADAGYDVWLGNSRGNTYGKRHVKYTPNMKEFWDFSFDEMAMFDLPATIDYVLNATGQKQLYYIGYSQGTLLAYALLSEWPEYSDKIKLFIALAPVSTVGYITNVVRVFAPLTKVGQSFLQIYGHFEFLPNGPIIKLVSEYLCASKVANPCAAAVSLFFNPDLAGLNQTRIPVYAFHAPDATSTKNILHYGEMVNSKKFMKYDYGIVENMEKYNQSTPPEYDVSRITTPVVHFWSLNDNFADPIDVGLLEKKLKSLVHSYLVPSPAFNHMDFAYSTQANKLVYMEVLKLLEDCTTG